MYIPIYKTKQWQIALLPGMQTANNQAHRQIDVRTSVAIAGIYIRRACDAD